MNCPYNNYLIVQNQLVYYYNPESLLKNNVPDKFSEVRNLRITLFTNKIGLL